MDTAFRIRPRICSYELWAAQYLAIAAGRVAGDAGDREVARPDQDSIGEAEDLLVGVLGGEGAGDEAPRPPLPRVVVQAHQEHDASTRLLRGLYAAAVPGRWQDGLFSPGCRVYAGPLDPIDCIADGEPTGASSRATWFVIGLSEDDGALLFKDEVLLEDLACGGAEDLRGVHARVARAIVGGRVSGREAAPIGEHAAAGDLEEMLSYRVGHLPVVEASPCGEWRLQAFYVEQGSRAQLLAAVGGHRVPEGLYMGLFQGEGRGPENLWMSDTPPEVSSMLPAIRGFADPSCRRVLIGGLGLGVLVKAALGHRHVEKVDVVERQPEVIELVASHYDADPRLTIHEADALTFLPEGEWDLAYYDIWRDVRASNCADFERIRRLVGDRARKLEFWHRERSERLLEEETAKPGEDRA